jgi:hypothetical protein
VETRGTSQALLEANRAAIVDGGGIEPIVLLLHEGGNGGKKNAAAALARLAEKGGEKPSEKGAAEKGAPDKAAEKSGAEMEEEKCAAGAAIAQAGAIAPLVNLLSGENGDGAQEEGAGALYALADNAANRLNITEAGGIGPLVVLLGSTNAKVRRDHEQALAPPPSPHVSPHVWSAPRHLCGPQLLPTARARRLRGRVHSSQARAHAEGALVRLSIENANRAIIIEKLVGMLHDDGGTSGGTAGGSGSGAGSAGAQEQAAAALANLASDSAENRQSIVQAGGIEPLLQLLQVRSCPC